MKSILRKIGLTAALLLGAVASRGTANFPGTILSDSNLLVAVNNCGTLLTANITSGATTIGVAATACFPTTGYVTIDNEAIRYTGKTGTTFTGCTRGADGTTAASHTIGSAADQYVIAAYHNIIKDELIAMTTYFLQGSQVHITTSTGNFGLGTATPGSTLEILTTGSYAADFTKTSADANAWTKWTNDARSWLVGVRGDTSDAFAIFDNTAGANRLTINTSGLVNIPATFSVTGGSTLAGTSVTSLTNSSLTAGRIPVASTGGLLVDYSTFVFTTAGVMGVGIAAPSASVLQLNHDTGTTFDRIFQVRNGSWGNGFAGASSNILHYGTDMTALAFHTASDMGTTGSALPSNERLRITATGVGVGTTATEKLDVRGTGGTYALLVSTSSTGAPVALGVTNAGNVTMNGTLGVTGNVNMSGDLAVTGTLTAGGLSFSSLSISTLTVTSSATIKGTTSGNDAGAGNYGEYISSAVATVNFPTSGQYGDAASIPLTAGDWDVSVAGQQTYVAGTLFDWRIGVSSTSGNSASGLTAGTTLLTARAAASTLPACASIPRVRINITSTTTYYLKLYSGHDSTAPTFDGQITARRVR